LGPNSRGKGPSKEAKNFIDYSTRGRGDVAYDMFTHQNWTINAHRPLTTASKDSTKDVEQSTKEKPGTVKRFQMVSKSNHGRRPTHKKVGAVDKIYVQSYYPGLIGKLHMCFRLTPRLMSLDDLELL